MRAILLHIAALLLLAPMVSAQNYIGVHKDAVRQFVPDDFPGFVLDAEGRVNHRSFVKFVDLRQEQTLLFVFDLNEICVSMSRMYNTWLYDKLLNNLNHSYLYLGSNTWIEDCNGQQFEIRLKRNEWYVTVVTRRRKQTAQPQLTFSN